MQIGAMNNPSEPVASEIAWMAELKLDFIDLTLEPPEAATWRVDANDLRRRLHDHGLGVIGHTAFYLPLASSFESLRCAALDELKRAAELFAALGAKWMNLHPDGYAPFTDDATILRRNMDSLAAIAEFGKTVGVRVMLENVPGRFNSVAQLEPIFRRVPEAGLHLDIGHSNLSVEHNTAGELIHTFSDRLAHVHLHDNRGGHADLHLALGMGNMDVPHHVRVLRESGYDGTITLEVFSKDRHFLAYSRDRLREYWDTAAAPA
ncbi:sugar phosphate isomerase/epimerase [Opitutaceae bacterium EW11]|nr:sugar phosphate isomerase/epimerase [Opitutaceae bacterium EW11]